MNERTRRIAHLALFGALTLVLCYVESTIPLPVSIPGVKLGLANVAVLIALYLMGPRWALSIMLLKVVVTSLFVGAPSMIAFSLAGSALAFVGMLAAWRSGKVGVVTTSIIAALLHNVGQLLAAAVIMGTPAIFLNLPVMIISACIMGAATGSVVAGVMKALPNLSRLTPNTKQSTRHKSLG